MSEQPWMQTASGRPWTLTAPRPEQVHWPDIAESLAKLCRFNGHCTAFYSVAQHCCLVAEALAPQYRLYGLLHDAHEAILGDVTTPLKEALRDLSGSEALDHLAALTDRAIFEAADLPPAMPDTVAAAVKRADLRLLATERRDLLAPCTKPWPPLPEPLSQGIIPWNCARARAEWLKRLGQYLSPHKEAETPHQQPQRRRHNTCQVQSTKSF